MKEMPLFFILLAPIICFAQTPRQYIGTTNNIVQARGGLMADSSLYLGIHDTTFVPDRIGCVVTRPQDNLLYVYATILSSTHWYLLHHVTLPTQIFYYPEEYGAVADSSTDCTNAVRAAIAAMGNYGGILQFSQGNYVITDSIIIPSNVTVAGVAGNANTNEIVMTVATDNFYKGSSTNILFRGNNKNCFVAGDGAPVHQHHGINFKDFNLRYQGTTPTAGAGILIVDGGNYTMEKITVTGFYDCVYQKVACYETVRSCVFGDFARFGFACTNEYVADWMDIALTDCFFYTGNTYLRPRACFYSSSPGGIKLMNCKTNLGVYDSLYLARYSIELTDSTGWSQDVLISNMSLESFYKSAIKMNFKASPNRQRLIGLTNIQTYTIFDAVEPAIDISYGSPSAGTSGQVVLENILAYNAGEVANANAAVRLTNVQYPFIGKISARFYAKPYYCISCSIEKYTYTLDRYYLDSNKTTLWSPGEMNICSDSSLVSGGNSPIIFLQGGSGLAAQAMKIDNLRRVVMYNSATTNPNAWLYVRKDTNTFVAADIINNSTGAAAWSMLRLTAAGNSSAELFVPGSGSAGYGIIGSRNLGLFNAGFDIALMADGANIKFGNSGVETARFTGGRLQIGTTAAQSRRLYVSGSVGAHKDSIPILSAIGSNYLLAIDTSLGDERGRFKRILPSSLTTTIIGTGTNDNAIAGNLGQEINSTSSTYANYTTTATYQAIDSITLTAGDWDISAFSTFSGNSATLTSASDAIFVISTTINSDAGSTQGKNIAYVSQTGVSGTNRQSVSIPPYRVSIASTTKYYLNTQSTFTAGNPQCAGGLRARRMR